MEGKGKGKGVANVQICYACQTAGLPCEHNYMTCPVSMAQFNEKRERLLKREVEGKGQGKGQEKPNQQ